MLYWRNQQISPSHHCIGAEHWVGFQGRKENSPLYKHALDAHCGEIGKVKFRMRIVMQHFTALGRQIHESVAIARKSLSGVNLNNSKLEGAKKDIIKSNSLISLG